MPGRRSKAKVNWPTGLYSNTINGVTYYRWLDPRTKKMVSLGREFEYARQAAATKNTELMFEPVQRLLNRMDDGVRVAVGFGVAADEWLAHAREQRKGRGDEVRTLSNRTLTDYKGYVRRFKAAFGESVAIGSLDLRAVSDYLDTYGKKARARNMARGVLDQIWTYAISRGWAKDNVPEQTLKVDHAVLSNRLSIEQFNAITEAARGSDEDAWFAAAAEFALYCDQRRSDVAKIPASAWNARTGVLQLVQGKTRHRITLRAGPKLRAAITACLSASPTGAGIVRKPGVTGFVGADTLTRTFSRLRDELIRQRHPAWRAYKPIKDGARPTDGRPPWREIRSLGAHLAKSAELDSKSLGGWAQASTEDLYQKGHVKTFEAESL